MSRELDDLILDLRTNEMDIGTWVLRTRGDANRMLAYDRLLLDNCDAWLANEIIHYLKRTLKRLDVTSHSLIALVEPGSCFAGCLLELALAADRSFHLSGVLPGTDPGAGPATVTVDSMNLGPLPMGNGLTRLHSRFFGNESSLAGVERQAGAALQADDAAKAGLVTFAVDGLHWEEQVRIAIEERVGFMPDVLAGLEMNYRLIGPETMETKIFGRLAAWQNWIVNQPNSFALGPMYLQEIISRLLQSEERERLIGVSHSEATYAPVFGAMEYMRRHLDEPMSVRMLAERMSMSESAFAHLFRQCVGMPPYRFLKQLRLEHARDLLMEERHKVSEVAVRVGYASPFHFITEFKNYFGETLGSYLQRLQAPRRLR